MSFASSPFSGSSSAASSAAVSAGVVSADRSSNGSAGALDTYVKSPDQIDARKAAAGRVDTRFRDKLVAGKLLEIAGEKLAKRALAVQHCRHVRYQPEVGLDRADNAAWLSGVKTCGSAWFCPVCSAVISRHRREELNLLLSRARADGLSVVMLTLTARHRRGMVLASWLDAFRAAQDTLRDRREWRALKPLLVGTVAATEVTHSARNGFHPHVHLLMIFRAPEADALRLADGLRDPWFSSLAGRGLSGSAKGWSVQSASQAAQYVAKFGPAEDMTLAQAKSARGDGRTPWQILASIAEAGRDASPSDRAAWLEYACAFHGRRQLVWSKNLKAAFGIGEVSDDDAAAAEAGPDPERVAVFDAVSWVHARKRKAALLGAAIRREDIANVLRGPSDVERWRNSSGVSAVVESE